MLVGKVIKVKKQVKDLKRQKKYILFYLYRYIFKQLSSNKPDISFDISSDEMLDDIKGLVKTKAKDPNAPKRPAKYHFD